MVDLSPEVQSAIKAAVASQWQFNAAIIAATASIVVVAIKWFFDRRERESRQRFEVGQVAARQTFETEQRLAREAFEAESRAGREEFERQECAAREAHEESERLARQAFETQERQEKNIFQNDQERKRAEANAATLALIEEKKAQLSVQINEFLHQQKWRFNHREGMLERLAEAKIQLDDAIGGLNALVDRGPVYGNLTMITETANTLVFYSKFSKIMKHHSFKGPLGDHAQVLVDHITKLLLTLSPEQTIRADPARIELLKPLKSRLAVLGEQFAELCRDFDHNPHKYDYGATKEAGADLNPSNDPARLI